MKNYLLFFLLWAFLFTSCNIEDDTMNSYKYPFEISDFKNWFDSQEIGYDFIGDKELNWSNAQINILPDGNTQQVTIELYRGKNSLGNDSVRELQIAKVKDSYVGGIKVFSYFKKTNASVIYYSLTGQIIEEGEYFTQGKQYLLLKKYSYEGSQIRLRSGYENSDPCDNTQYYKDSATPIYINNTYNSDAYNCHTYVWGPPDVNDPCYMSSLPLWNNCPNISESGYSEVKTGYPQVGDKWVSYGYVSGWGYVPVHSAIVLEVKNGSVTKVEAKCGESEIYIYNPDCSSFSSYKTSDIRYYR